MIHFEQATLSNGLKLVVTNDPSTPLVAVCTTYMVGTRDEQMDKTGFAHLFEHLMFGGSENAPDFDGALQDAGGENNAYTSNDFTVYYETLPLENLETALWLESDRMAALTLNKKALKTQQKVVVEEFKETCLNEPYGDVWHFLSPLVYTQHPYKIPTIGLSFEHIEQATLEDVKSFFERYYRPDNAILTLCGNINLETALPLVEKYFGRIPASAPLQKNYPQEPTQTEKRSLWHQGEVPLNAIYLAFRAAPRASQAYYIEDVLSDLLAEGETGSLYQQLVKERQIFTEIDAYTTATLDDSMFIIEAKLYDNQTFETAEATIWEELRKLQTQPLNTRDWEKLQNRIESNFVFGELSTINKAMNLGFYTALGDANLINTEADLYRSLSPVQICEHAQALFQPERASVLYYQKKKA